MKRTVRRACRRSLRRTRSVRRERGGRGEAGPGQGRGDALRSNEETEPEPLEGGRAALPKEGEAACRGAARPQEAAGASSGGARTFAAGVGRGGRLDRRRYGRMREAGGGRPRAGDGRRKPGRVPRGFGFVRRRAVRRDAVGLAPEGLVGGTPVEGFGKDLAGPVAEIRRQLGLGIERDRFFGDPFTVGHFDAADQPLERGNGRTGH